jgi:outer membrane receptor protein involved in Fe transport
MRKIITWLIGLFCFYNSITGQYPGQGFNAADMPKNGVISGKVYDSSTDVPLEYATLALYRMKDSSLVTGSITNNKGEFTLNELPYGMYYLEADFLGYEKFRLNKILITPQKQVVDVGKINISPSSVSLDAVEVIADNNRVEYKIDKKVITLSQDMTSSGGTVAQALENTPSIEVDIEGNVTLRGSSNYKVLIDGKPSVIQGSEALQQIPASSVQSVEIITNPSAKYDPDGDAGIINIVMKKQKQKGFNGIINASAGTREKYSADFLLNFKQKKTNFFIGGEISDNAFHGSGNNEQRIFGFDTTYYRTSEREGLFKRTGYSLKAGADYYLDNKNTLTLQGSIGKRNFERNFFARFHEYYLPVSDELYYTEDNRGPHENNYYNLSLDYRKEFDNPMHELKASVYYSSNFEKETQDIIENITNSNWEIIAPASDRSRSSEETPEKNIRAQIDYIYPIKEGVKFEAGLQSRWDIDNSDYIFEDYDADQNKWVNNPNISNKLEYVDAIQSVYAIYTGTFKKFGYQAGLRTEYDNRYINQVTLNEDYRYERLHFFPSFYITKQFPKQMQLQLSYSRRIRRPNERDLNPFKEVMDNQNIRQGNPELIPEFTNSYELNFQVPFKKNFLSLETFYRETTNSISWFMLYDSTSNMFINTSRNADKATAAGAELMANINIAKWWQVNLSGNIFQYTLTGENDDGDYIKRTTTSWGSNGNMIFRLKWDTRLQIMGMYRGPSVTLQGKRDGFFFTNIAIRKDFLNKKLSLTLNVRDVFGTTKNSFTSEGSGFYTFNEFKRESPVVMLTLSYRINNYKMQQKRNGDTEEIREMDFDNEM